MNILVLSLEFPPQPGGIGEYAFQTAKALSRFGHKITALVSFGKAEASDRMDFKSKQSFEIVDIGQYDGRTLFLLKRLFSILSICRKAEIDLIINVSPNSSIIVYLIKLILGTPLIVIGHGSEFLKSNLLHDSFINIAYSFSDLIVANSFYTKKLIHKRNISNKVSVVFPGADSALFDPNNYETRTRLDNKIVLTVGALSIRKGHKFVIEAIDILRKEIRDIEYWIIGIGPEKESLEELVIAKGLKDHVKILGFIKRNDLPDYFAKARLFILNSNKLDTSQVEGFGIVLIEANLMKLPVIGARNSGMEDAIDEHYNGLLVDSTDATDIAKKIRFFLNNDELSIRYGNNGFLRASKKFTWGYFGARLNTIIEEEFK